MNSGAVVIKLLQFNGLKLNFFIDWGEFTISLSDFTNYIEESNNYFKDSAIEQINSQVIMPLENVYNNYIAPRTALLSEKGYYMLDEVVVTALRLHRKYEWLNFWLPPYFALKGMEQLNRFGSALTNVIVYRKQQDAQTFREIIRNNPDGKLVSFVYNNFGYSFLDKPQDKSSLGAAKRGFFENNASYKPLMPPVWVKDNPGKAAIADTALRVVTDPINYITPELAVGKVNTISRVLEVTEITAAKAIRETPLAESAILKVKDLFGVNKTAGMQVKEVFISGRGGYSGTVTGIEKTPVEILTKRPSGRLNEIDLNVQGVGEAPTLSNAVYKRESSKAGKDFVGTLKGQSVELPGVKTEVINYTKRNPVETAELRKLFDGTERKKFLKGLSEDAERLKNAGLSDTDIARMKDGLTPKGWQVHHKVPLDAGGTNAMDNLVLINNDPYHKVITNYQNTSTKGLLPGETKILEWPIPEGNIYPPGP